MMVEIFFNSTTGEIIAHPGGPLKAEEAKRLWQKMKVKDCNLSFQRLATEFDFDVNAALAWYKEIDNAKS